MAQFLVTLELVRKWLLFKPTENLTWRITTTLEMKGTSGSLGESSDLQAQLAHNLVKMALPME
jgi:hypothetical protein